MLIEPIRAACEKPFPSTISLIADDVLTHWTVCQAPSLSAGPAMSSLDPAEPMKPHDACPEGWYSTLNSPGSVKRPLRIRSQSGEAGACVVCRWIVSVTSWLPGFRSLVDGTETKPDPASP